MVYVIPHITLNIIKYVSHIMRNVTLRHWTRNRKFTDNFIFFIIATNNSTFLDICYSSKILYVYVMVDFLNLSSSVTFITRKKKKIEKNSNINVECLYKKQKKMISGKGANITNRFVRIIAATTWRFVEVNVLRLDTRGSSIEINIGKTEW